MPAPQIDAPVPSESGAAFATGRRPLVAIYAAAPTRIGSDLEMVEPLVAPLTDADMRSFVASNATVAFPAKSGDLGSAFWPPPVGLFDKLILGRSLRLFKNAWGAAMISHTARALRPGGQLIIWFTRSSPPRGYWRLADLEEFLGTAAIDTKNDHAVFVLDQVPKPPPSILNWYFESFSEVILHDMAIRQPEGLTFKELEDPLLAGFCVHPPIQELTGFSSWSQLLPSEELNIPHLDVNGRFDFNAELEKTISLHSYFIGGISYKSAVIGGIIRDNLPQTSGVRLADLGGGYGLLAAELLLDRDCPVDSALTIDGSFDNLVIGAKMYRGNLNALKGRLRFWQGKIESYPFDEQFDIVTMIASFLYIPRQQRKATLKRIFSTLSSGGLLIIHESIRSPTFETAPYYDLMFTVEELDGLLGGLGEIRRYLSTAVARIDQQEAGARTVFRVLKKAFS